MAAAATTAAAVGTTRGWWNIHASGARRGRTLSHTLWFRDALREPSVDAAHAWSIWQFWPRGRIAGIDGPVDLDALRGGLDRLGGP